MKNPASRIRFCDKNTLPENLFYVNAYSIRFAMNNLTALIPYRNGSQTITRLLDALPSELPIIVVDDLSTPPYQSERPNVRVLRPPTRGYFAGSVNAGLVACDTDVLILNQDVWLEGDTWQTIVQQWQTDGYGIAGGGVFGHPAWTRGYVEGQFMFLSRAAVQRVGLLNARDYPLWGCTAELQLRMCRAGLAAAPVQMSAYGLRHERGAKPYGTSIAATLEDEPTKQGLFVRTPPAVSVIITSYNYGRFLRDAVHSLIGGPTSLGKFEPQTFQSFEVVIVDDGSTDNTREVAEEIADDWKGVRFLRLDQNVGSAAAMNAGIAASCGKWLAPLDADDMMETTRLETLYRAAIEHPHSVIYDDITAFADSKGPLDIIHPEAKKRPATVSRAEMWVASYGMPDYDFERILEHNGMHKGIFFERAAWKEVGGYAESFRDGREDWQINVALGEKGYCGIHVKAPLYLGRRHDKNRTNTNGKREWRQYFIDKMHAQFPRLYAGERTKMCCGKKSKTNGNGNGNGTLGMAMQSNARSMGRFAMSGIGQTGMVKLEYLPTRAGTQQFVGSVSRQTYVFGGSRKVAYVDARDVPAFLELVDARRPIFQRYEEPIAPTAPTGLETTGGASGDVTHEIPQVWTEEGKWNVSLSETYEAGNAVQTQTVPLEVSLSDSDMLDQLLADTAKAATARKSKAKTAPKATKKSTKAKASK